MKATINRFRRIICPFCGGNNQLRKEKENDVFSCDWCRETFRITRLSFSPKVAQEK
jgi:ribosomal protein L37AE/L43A